MQCCALAAVIAFVYQPSDTNFFFNFFTKLSVYPPSTPWSNHRPRALRVKRFPARVDPPAADRPARDVLRSVRGKPYTNTALRILERRRLEYRFHPLPPIYPSFASVFFSFRSRRCSVLVRTETENRVRNTSYSPRDFSVGVSRARNEFLRVLTAESLIFIKSRNFGRLFIGRTLVKMINERIKE